MSERACAYRKIEHLEDLQGTAVTVQAMVFGNDDASGAGVAFSRDPSTGDAEPVIDVLFGSQGEASFPADTIRKPKRRSCGFPRSLRNCARRSSGLNKNFATFKMSSSPSKTANYGFCRRARRTYAGAAVRFAIDFVQEGITPAEALQRLDGSI